MKRSIVLTVLSLFIFTTFGGFIFPEKTYASLVQNDLDRWLSYSASSMSTMGGTWENDFNDIATTVFNAYKDIPNVSPVLAFIYILNGIPKDNETLIHNPRSNSSVYLNGMYGLVFDKTKLNIDWTSTLGLTVGNLFILGPTAYFAGAPVGAVATGVHIIASGVENMVSGGPQMNQNLNPEQLTAKQVYESLSASMQYEALYSQVKSGTITQNEYTKQVSALQNTTQQSIDTLQKNKITASGISPTTNATAVSVSSAANNYVLLEPSVLNTGLSSTLGKSSDGKSIAIGNNIGDITSFIFVLLVTASLVAAVWMVMAGSFIRMTTDSIYKKTEGSEKIRHAIYGLLIVLTMYLVILTINPDMLRKGLTLSNYQNTDTSVKATLNKTYTPIPISTVGTYTHTESVALLTAVGINTNHQNNDCTPAEWANINGHPYCTSLDGLPKDTVNMLISLKRDCDSVSSTISNSNACNIVISGGTEYGHASHGKGLYPVDIRCAGNGKNICTDTSTGLYQYIYNLKVGMTGYTGCNNGVVYGPYRGFYFCNELNYQTHWHVFRK